MKYNGDINYVKCLEWKLNLSQGAVMDLMIDLSSWAKPIVVDGDVYYYLATGELVKQLPIVSEKKDTFLKILKVLKDKQLIESVFSNNKSYYRLSELGKTFKYSSEKNPIELGNKSEPTSELNPNNNNINNNLNKNNNYTSDFEEFWGMYPKQRAIDKKNMFKKYLKIENKEELVTGTKKYLNFWKTENTPIQYIPLISTYLNQERYLTPPPTPNSASPLPPATLEIPKVKAQQIADFRQITVEQFIADRQRETGKKVILT